MSASYSTKLDPALTTLHADWQTQLMTMHNFLIRATTDDVLNCDAAVKATSTCRMIDFNNQNVSLKNTHLSRADMMFVLECYNMNCSIASLRKMALITDAAEICARLCIIGSRHTRKSRMQPLDDAGTTHLLHLTASWIVQFGCLDDDVDEIMTMIAPLGGLTLAPSTKRELHELMVLPFTVKQQQKQVIDTIRREEVDQSPLRVFALKPSDDDMMDEIADEEIADEDAFKGSYWIVETPAVITRIISFASRVFHQVTLEQYVMSLYPIAAVDPFVYPPAALNNLQTLVMSRCTTAAGDTFVAKFREAVHRWSLPMGTMSVRYRSVVTQFQQSSPANLMEQELGMDTSQALYSIVNVPLTSIAGDANHDLHDILSFFTLGTLIENRSNVDFPSCVIMSCDLDTRHSVLAKLTESHEARRPIIVDMMQKMWLHDQGRLYACKSMTDAILKWLIMIKYAWKTNDGTKVPRYCNRLKAKSIASISDEVLGAGLHTLLPAW